MFQPKINKLFCLFLIQEIVLRSPAMFSIREKIQCRRDFMLMQGFVIKQTILDGHYRIVITQQKDGRRSLLVNLFLQSISFHQIFILNFFPQQVLLASEVCNLIVKTNHRIIQDGKSRAVLICGQGAQRSGQMPSGRRTGHPDTFRIHPPFLRMFLQDFHYQDEQPFL